MKKTLYFIVALLITFSILTKNASADDTGQKVNYLLAYPGILPDSPFYIVKVLWFKFQERSIKDTSQKVDFLLLQTDKMILASSILQEKHENTLSKETALKGENNFTNIVNLYRTINRKPDRPHF